MSGMFDVLGILFKRLFVAFFVVGGLLLGMLIAVSTLIAITVVQLVRRVRGPRSPSPAAGNGNVFEGEYSVVEPTEHRATILMVPPPKSSSGLP